MHLDRWAVAYIERVLTRPLSAAKCSRCGPPTILTRPMSTISPITNRSCPAPRSDPLPGGRGKFTPACSPPSTSGTSIPRKKGITCDEFAIRGYLIR